MSLLPTITIERLNNLLRGNETIPTVEVLNDNGDYKGVFVSPPKEGGMTIYDDIKNHAEYLGVRGNSVLHPSILENINSSVRSGPCQDTSSSVKPVAEDLKPSVTMKKKKKYRARRVKVKPAVSLPQ